MARGRLFVGTSGFAYKEWKPAFYPAELRARDMLRYYAERLSSVEINNTFYRAPTAKLLEGWVGETPGRFVFTLKAPQRITHVARLRDVEEEVGRFLDVARVLDSRLGAILFQCPPFLRRDAALLRDFLATLAGPPFRFAMEFRHESWKAPEVEQALADRGVALCVADTEAEPGTMRRTAADFVYLRLRRSTYDDAARESWASEVERVLDAGADAYVYWKHEDDPAGVRYAIELSERLGGAGEPAAVKEIR